MKIIKFGGSSVAKPERIKSIISIIKARLSSDSMAVVFSAFGGVTDQLISTSALALSGNDQYKLQLEAIEKRHLDSVRELIPIQNQSHVLAKVKVLINELDDILHGIFLIKERTPRSLDYIMSFGERLSALIISEAFKVSGIDAYYLDARQVIVTDSQFNHAKVNFEITNRRIQDYFSAAKGLQVITGFIASSPEGETTTLGRSGSDYTAAIFAGALQAEVLEIWTDVDGMMTADPRKVKKAFTVHEMSYEEAMELSHFGAKVIFPATMQPAMINGIPILIKNTFNPEFAGTLINAKGNGKNLIIKGISSVMNVSLLNVQGSGLLGVVGVSMRLFEALARERINVILISQASSEHSICFAIESAYAARAKSAIESEFQYEIKSKEMDEVIIENDLAIIAIVGENMKHNPGTSGRMFVTLGKNGINVQAIAQGSSELNISAVIRQSDVSKALNSLHEAFFLSDKKALNIFLIGTGLIGSELLHMMGEEFNNLSENTDIEINLLGIANSTKMIFDEGGLSLSKASIDLMKSTGEPMRLDDFIKRMIDMNLSNSIFVDCTSSEHLTDYYSEILEANISVVTPNKKANSGALEKYRQIRKSVSRRGVKFFYETNVGAGLPVINTLNDLQISGDKIIRIEAVLSGTLNFIFSSLQGDAKFSEIVRLAKEKGFTEPDPRDDLNGMDVARKALILSREIGNAIELTDIEVDNLVPEDCRGELSTELFFKQLQHHDHYFDAMKNQAEAEGLKLRYSATIEKGKVKVSLVRVDASHPFYSLSGSDNVILISTNRYHERPMVIRGPGAGATVTAAGVFADIIRIGNYSN